MKYGALTVIHIEFVVIFLGVYSKLAGRVGAQSRRHATVVEEASNRAPFNKIWTQSCKILNFLLKKRRTLWSFRINGGKKDLASFWDKKAANLGLFKQRYCGPADVLTWESITNLCHFDVFGYILDNIVVSKKSTGKLYLNFMG